VLHLCKERTEEEEEKVSDETTRRRREEGTYSSGSRCLEDGKGRKEKKGGVSSRARGERRRKMRWETHAFEGSAASLGATASS